MKKVLRWIGAIILGWIVCTVWIQRVECSGMTETELFKSIPDCVMLNFKFCNE